MPIFTSRELEFLAGLSRGWRRLYRNELARLLKEDDMMHDGRQLRSAFPFQLHTSSHSLRTAAFSRSSAGVPSNTMRPWQIT